MLLQALLYALVGLLGAVALALPAPAGGVRYSDISKLNDDSYKATNLDVHDEAESTTRITLLDLENAEVDAEKQLDATEAGAEKASNTLLSSLGLDDDRFEFVHVEITNNTSHDLEFDQVESRSRDEYRETRFEKEGDGEEPKKRRPSHKHGKARGGDHKSKPRRKHEKGRHELHGCL